MHHLLLEVVPDLSILFLKYVLVLTVAVTVHHMPQREISDALQQIRVIEDLLAHVPARLVGRLIVIGVGQCRVNNVGCNPNSRVCGRGRVLSVSPAAQCGNRNVAGQHTLRGRGRGDVRHYHVITVDPQSSDALLVDRAQVSLHTSPARVVVLPQLVHGLKVDQVQMACHKNTARLLLLLERVLNVHARAIIVLPPS